MKHFSLVISLVFCLVHGVVVQGYAKSNLEGVNVIVSVNKCNLRRAPDTSADNVISVLSKNQTASVVDTVTINGHLWYLVQTGQHRGWLSASVSTLKEKSKEFEQSDLIYNKTSIVLKEEYPSKYINLYNKIKKYYSKEEFDSLLSDQSNIRLQGEYKDKLVFLASPISVKTQSRQHQDWVPLLVNPKTLDDGIQFFETHKSFFLDAQKETGVQAKDIIAILNWESRLGTYRGKYDIFKVFVGQYFHIDEIEFELFQKGHYQKQGAMDRSAALKRIQRLKQRALNNLSHLLIQAKTTGFDPLTVKGSWAGAIGIPQFMPASMSYAVDGDKNGIIDLNTIADSIFSVATYLKRHHYKERGREYAFKRYNADDMYVRGVKLYSDEFEKRMTQ